MAKSKIGKFELGGIAGSLLVAVALGQIGGIAISNEVKSIFLLYLFLWWVTTAVRSFLIISAFHPLTPFIRILCDDVYRINHGRSSR
ncbi:hypothetical protein O9993_19140 [Vibrio lentus]|nr:hypothetical protein [Vibrio lentus]